MTVYPDAWSIAPWITQSNETVLSGSVSNLQAEDSSYMVVQSDTLNSVGVYDSVYLAHTGYAPSQILAIEYGYKGHETGYSSLGMLLQLEKPVSATFDYAGSLTVTASDAWWTYTALNTGGMYVGTNGVVGLLSCICGTGVPHAPVHHVH